MTFNIQFFLIFMTYITLIDSDWVEVPYINPPSALIIKTTPPPSFLTQSQLIRGISSKIPSNVRVYGSPNIQDDNLDDSYNQYSSSKSHEDSRYYNDYQSKPSWSDKKNVSPFSGSDFHDSKNYYRWRNSSVSKVKGSPHIVDSVDYSVVSPDVTILDEPGYPKNVLISSKTSIIPDSDLKDNRFPVKVDSKLGDYFDEKEDHEETSTDRIQPEHIKVDEEISQEIEENSQISDNDEELNDDDGNEEAYVEDQEDEEYEQNDLEDLEVDEYETAESVKSAQVYKKPLSWKDISFSSFMQYLKSIQDNFMHKTARTVEGKIAALEGLKNKLYKEVIYRVDSVFGTKKHRPKRSIWSHKEHEHEHETEKHKDGIDFPSAEGALLSIAFLTFAVFLIKLVIQVITAIKYKYVAYNYGSGTTGGGVFGAIKQNTNARQISDDYDSIRDTVFVLDAIKE